VRQNKGRLRIKKDSTILHKEKKLIFKLRSAPYHLSHSRRFSKKKPHHCLKCIAKMCCRVRSREELISNQRRYRTGFHTYRSGIKHWWKQSNTLPCHNAVNCGLRQYHKDFLLKI